MSVKSTRLVKERKTAEMAENIYSKFDRNENGSLQYCTAHYGSYKIQMVE